jgi:hypothetical protein
MKTKSLWGSPPGRFYSFLRRVEATFLEQPIIMGIFGCADGKFVLPCARKGHHVIAVDEDPVALFGTPSRRCRRGLETEGLVQRLKREGLERYVTVYCHDLVTSSPATACHGVFLSGTINYSSDDGHSVQKMIQGISACVRVEGFIYFDYMLSLKGEEKRGRYYFRRGELRSYFQPPGWSVLYDRVLPPQMEEPHSGSPARHYHQWGHLCVQKLVGGAS